MGSINSRRQQKSSRQTQVIRSAIEVMEKRVLLSTVIVNSIQDTLFPAGSANVSLRNAIAIANVATEPTTISFDSTIFAARQTIVLAGSQLELSNSLHPTTITGPGAKMLSVSGNDLNRVLLIDQNVSANISGLTITHGNVYDPALDGGIKTQSGGGGILNLGTLTLTNAALTNNTAGFTGGGGINNQGTAQITNVTIANNRVLQSQFALGANGGGMVQEGIATLVNCTIAGNVVSDGSYGGGICVGANIQFDIINCTISDNTASASFVGGGGLCLPFTAMGVTTMTNSIVAGNHLVGGAILPYIDIAPNGGVGQWNGRFVSNGNNIIGVVDGGWTFMDRVGRLPTPFDAKLGPLSDNGGPTLTMMPLADSRALDTGNTANVPVGINVDQRGFLRVVNSLVDVGAVERQANLTVPAAPSSAKVQSLSATSVELAWSDNSFNETRFTIEQARSATGPWAQIAILGSNSTNRVISGLSANQTYYFRVRSGNYAGDSTLSNIASTVETVRPAVFKPGVSVGSTSSYAYNLTSADFNGDGRNDIAVATYGGPGDTADCDVLLNNGDGTFTTTAYGLGVGFATRIRAGDLNGDNKPDLILITSTLNVLINNGDGTFKSPAVYDINGYPYGGVLGDFDGDGSIDIVTAAGANFAIWFNNGTGLFGTPRLFATDEGVLDLAVGDFNGDGILDLAGNGGWGSGSILLGTGGGNFQPVKHFQQMVNTYYLTAADFNHDGKTDLVVNYETTPENHGEAQVHISKGDGTFYPPVMVIEGPAMQLSVGDYNRDGNLDLAEGSAGVQIAFGQGDGTFEPAVTFDSTYGFPALTTNDFNGDGRPDLAGSNGGTDVRILYNITPLATDPCTISGTLFDDLNANGTRDGNEPALVKSSVYLDMNNNGIADVGDIGTTTDATGKYTFAVAPGTYHVRKLLRSGYRITTPTTGYYDVTLSAGDNVSGKDFGQAPAGGTAATVSFSGPTSYAVGKGGIGVAVGDFNSDGKPDIAEADWVAGTVNILLGNGSGDFSAAGVFPAGASPGTISVADLNGDGKQDLVIPNFGDATVSILLGDGTGSFTNVGNLSVGSGPCEVAIADFNGDAKLDLAVPNRWESTITLLLGDGAGHFSFAGNITVGYGPSAVVARDFNRDEKMDLATAHADSPQISILLGDGAGHFGAPQVFATPNGPYDIEAGDFNSDGKVDLVAANHLAGKVSVLLGDGFGGFSALPDVASIDMPWFVVASDFNGDGKQDIAATSYIGGTVAVLLGDGTGHFSPPTIWVAVDYARNVAVGDFNLDGRPDLAVNGMQAFVVDDTRHVAVLLNTTPFATNGPTISGTVFDDTNANGQRDTGESVLVGSSVYLDMNNNGLTDTGDIGTTTDSNGKYTFAVAPGTYHVRKLLRPGYVITTPAQGFYDVTLNAGETVTAKDFGHVRAIVQWNPAGEFGLAGNPNGAWMYGYSNTLSSGLNLFDTSGQDSGVDTWRSSVLGIDPNVHHNATASTINLAGRVPLLPGDLTLHPGLAGQFTHILFSAPVAGTYRVDGFFGGADPLGTTTDVHVRANGSELFSGNISGARGIKSPFSLVSIQLGAGGTIDFAVGRGVDESYACDTTLLNVTIQKTSE